MDWYPSCDYCGICSHCPSHYECDCMESVELAENRVVDMMLIDCESRHTRLGEWEFPCACKDLAKDALLKYKAALLREFEMMEDLRREERES